MLMYGVNHIPQTLMNAVPTMEAVHKRVPTHKDLINAAVGLDTGLVAHIVWVRL